MVSLVLLAACGRPLLHAPPRPEPAHTPAAFPPTSASEIILAGMISGPCFGRCPAYRLAFSRSGLAIREGKVHTTFPRCSTASVSAAAFSAIADAIMASEFFRLDEHIGPGMLDVSYLSIAVAWGEGRSHSVTGARTPPELRGIRTAMDSVAGTLDWQAADDTTARRYCPPATPGAPRHPATH